MSRDGCRDTIADELAPILSGIHPGQLDRLTETLLSATRVFGAGAGRSGLMMKAFIMRLMQLGLRAYAVGETTTPAAAPGDWLIIGSSSGSTATMLALAERAKAAGAGLAVLTANPGSPLGRMADLVVEIPVATAANAARLRLGSPFELALLLALESLVPVLMAGLGVDEASMMRRHANLE